MANTAGVNNTVLRVRGMGEPETLDWNRAGSAIEGFVIRNVMNGLVAIDSAFHAVPDLAESWKASPDKRVYEFRLRDDKLWSDGKPVTAGDFVASWKRLLAPETKARYASLLFDIEGAEAFHKGEVKDFERVGVHAVGDRALKINLNKPMSHWEWVPSFYAAFPIRADRSEPADPALTLGDYRVEARENGRRITLRRNHPGPRSGEAEKVEITLVHDDIAALKLYDEGSLDLLPRVPSRSRAKMKSRSDFRAWPELRTVHLRLNTAQGPLAAVGARRAIAMSIDRARIQALYEGAFAPAYSLAPPGIVGYAARPAPAFNAKQARAELAKAGLDPARLPPLDLLTVAFDDEIILAQFIQQQLKDNLGLRVRIHALEPKRFYSPALNHLDYSMEINAWSADFPDPDNFYSIFLGNSGMNRYAWKNARYDELVTSARSATDPKARSRAYLSAQRILLEEGVATIPMYFGRGGLLVRSRVRGFKPGPFSWWSFRDLSIPQESPQKSPKKFQ